MIKRTDKYRYEYYKYYAGGDWRNPINYDMVLNTGRIGRKRCVDLVISYLKLKFPEFDFKELQ